MMLQIFDPAVAMFPSHNHQRGEPWQRLMHCPTLLAAVEQVAEIYEFQWHPYFIWMRSVDVKLKQFSRSQVPFQYAIESFDAAFSAIIDRVESPTLTAPNRSIQAGGVTISAPRQAFLRCLQRIDPSIDGSIDCPIGLAAANRQILNHCLIQPISSGAATLGMIEYLYVDVSATISQIVQHRGWTHQDSDFYYMIHGALAIAPSRDLLTLASTNWDDPQSRSQTAQSLILGGQYLWELYDGLYPDPTL